jgi:YD repeat-containing protein
VSTPTPGTTNSTQVITTYTYDSLGNVLTIQTPGNNVASTITTTLNYTTDNSYVQPDSINQPITVTDNLGKTTHLRYDAQGNLIAVIDALGNEWDQSFNIANKPLVTLAPATGQQGPGRSYAITNYAYAAGPVISVQTYDERNSTIPVYPSGYAAIREVDYGYDQAEHTLSITGGREPITCSYDAVYRLSSLTDGNSHTLQHGWIPCNHRLS